MINLMLQNRQPIIYGDGEQKRCFSDIDDCIYCLDKLITDKSIVSQTINIGPDEEYISINQLFKIISNKLQFNQMPKYFKDRPNEVKEASCSSDKARRLLNYTTKVDLDKSLDKLLGLMKGALILYFFDKDIIFLQSVLKIILSISLDLLDE